MERESGFYTMKGYSLHTEGGLTSAMEDYLEMAARLARQGGRVRVGDLARMLHVKASSATKMVQQLAQAGLVRGERYGEVLLTEQGAAAGEYLLYRHEVLHRFLCLLNHTDNELEQVEKLEHFLEKRTVENLEPLVRRLEKG